MTQITTRDQWIVQKDPHNITDGIVVAKSAGIVVDMSALSSYERLTIVRAIERGAIRAVHNEVRSRHEVVS